MLTRSYYHSSKPLQVYLEIFLNTHETHLPLLYSPLKSPFLPILENLVIRSSLHCYLTLPLPYLIIYLLIRLFIYAKFQAQILIYPLFIYLRTLNYSCFRKQRRELTSKCQIYSLLRHDVIFTSMLKTLCPVLEYEEARFGVDSNVVSSLDEIEDKNVQKLEIICWIHRSAGDDFGFVV